MKISDKRFSVLSVFVLMALAFSAVPASASSPDACSWSYDGATGPEHWSEICAPKNYTCESGTRQSPIDLPAAPHGNLPHLSFHYRPTPLDAENTGSTIEADIHSDSYLKIGHERYNLIQFHFHTPSEHQLEGESYPMELHFVHRNALGELAVVGVFLREGAENPLIQQIWDHIAEGEAGEAHVEQIEPEDLLPENREYYRYAGSLTTPPCTEGVRWHVLHEPIEVSEEQIEEFRAIFPHNARPLQELNGRTVLNSGL